MSHRGVYKVQTVARLTGFSPAVLRTWELRYDLLFPERTARGHRLYSQQDLLLLRAIKQLIDQGLNIGEIAQRGRSELLAGLGPESEVSPTTSSFEWVERALELARRGELEGLARELDNLLRGWSPEAAVTELVGEFMTRLESEPSIARPFLRCLERQVVFRLGQLLLAACPLGSHLPLAITAGFPGDAEEASILGVSYLLARHGWRVVYLGPNLSFADLDKALDLFQPQAAYLNVHRSSVFLVHECPLLDLAARMPDGCSLWVGGKGLVAKMDAPYLQSPGKLRIEEFRCQFERLRREFFIGQRD